MASLDTNPLEYSMEALVQRILPSPLGPLRLVASDVGMVGIYLPTQEGQGAPAPELSGAHPILDLAQAELEAYFAGSQGGFTVPTAPKGTDFQRTVWRALQGIPLGETTTYGALAVGLGKPGAMRAVGAANGRNPLSIIVPCHRVIGADGSLTGYAGGLPAKRWLLAHEAGMLGRAAKDPGPLFQATPFVPKGTP